MKLLKLTNEEFRDALDRLSAQPMPLKAAFRVKDIVGKVRGGIARFSELRMAALEKYGTRAEDGALVLDERGNVKFEPDKLETFVKELNDAGSTDFDIGFVTAGELGDEIQITADDAFILDGVLVE